MTYYKLNSMKRFLLCLAIFIVVTVIWYGESRKFFCLDNGNCVTIWKTYNNVCYIIPGRYYGIIRPSDNFIETSNNNFLTLYFTSELPNVVIYKSEQILTIKNADKDKWAFYDYNSNIQRFDSILYIANAKRNNDIKDNARLIDVFIGENYALDKKGKHL
jgi:hypothetical protein